VLACALPAPSTLDDVSILKAKESDRLAGIYELAQAGGAKVERSGDSLTLTPGAIPSELVLSSRGDHRMAMSAATLAVLGGSVLTLSGAEHVKKSFPAFWEELARCGVTHRTP
jgi:3-phosphoshikimate 1-carboxyvinyltransferase